MTNDYAKRVNARGGLAVLTFISSGSSQRYVSAAYFDNWWTEARLFMDAHPEYDSGYASMFRFELKRNAAGFAWEPVPILQVPEISR